MTCVAHPRPVRARLLRSRRIQALAHAAELHALRFWRVVDPDDVIVVFESLDGGVADIVIGDRQCVTESDEDGAIVAALRGVRRGVLVLVLAADGSAHVVPTALTRINSTGGDA